MLNVYMTFILTVIALFFLIIHSYYQRGFRITFNFFLFSFIAGMRKEAGSFLGPLMAKSPFETPFMHTTDLPLSFNILNVTVGWMLIFYLSWSLAEKINERVSRFKGKIFPLILWAGVLIAAFAYAIEATAINIGWWKWMFYDEAFAGFFVGGVHFFALTAWFYFGSHFLIPFYLIECSPFRISPFKCIFFLIPFVRTNIMLFSCRHFTRVLYEASAICILTPLAFFNRLSFDFPDFTARIKVKNNLLKVIKNIPMVATILLVGILMYFDVFVVKKASLIFSLFPLFVLLLLSKRGIALWIIAVVSVLGIILFGKLVIVAFIPVLLAYIFEGIQLISKKANTFKKV